MVLRQHCVKVNSHEGSQLKDIKRTFRDCKHVKGEMDLLLGLNRDLLKVTNQLCFFDPNEGLSNVECFTANVFHISLVHVK
ncbi:CLUMA_CG008303, isoform A [Clunio marinus]|uniref:CLUMA_CG008303, isoform A n=1 Tax=Clunio marinus TaxID=568069 RepID=A0A1J1I8R2_9DIPT|nr:CLUMA_CG008303, isoform A [Clunio marinus]